MVSLDKCTMCGNDFAPGEDRHFISRIIDIYSGTSREYQAVFCDECRAEKRAEEGIIYQ